MIEIPLNLVDLRIDARHPLQVLDDFPVAERTSWRLASHTLPVDDVLGC